MSMIYTFRLKRNVFYIHELLFVQQRLVHNKFKFMYFYFRFLINASIKQKRVNLSDTVVLSKWVDKQFYWISLLS